MALDDGVRGQRLLRAVHIGDNSKLFLESAEPRRAFRSTGRL